MPVARVRHVHGHVASTGSHGYRNDVTQSEMLVILFSQYQYSDNASQGYVNATPWRAWQVRYSIQLFTSHLCIPYAAPSSTLSWSS